MIEKEIKAYQDYPYRTLPSPAHNLSRFDAEWKSAISSPLRQQTNTPPTPPPAPLLPSTTNPHRYLVRVITTFNMVPRRMTRVRALFPAIPADTMLSRQTRRIAIAASIGRTADHFPRVGDSS